MYREWIIHHWTWGDTKYSETIASSFWKQQGEDEGGQQKKFIQFKQRRCERSGKVRQFMCVESINLSRVEYLLNTCVLSFVCSTRSCKILRHLLPLYPLTIYNFIHHSRFWFSRVWFMYFQKRVGIDLFFIILCFCFSCLKYPWAMLWQSVETFILFTLSHFSSLYFFSWVDGRRSVEWKIPYKLSWRFANTHVKRGMGGRKAHIKIAENSLVFFSLLQAHYIDKFTFFSTIMIIMMTRQPGGGWRVFILKYSA